MELTPPAPGRPVGAKAPKPAPRLRITVDTREQTPLPFPEDLVELTRATVPVFDYALTGDEAAFAVERKSASDFLSSLIIQENYNRELAKIWKARAAGFALVVYVIEADFAHFMDERVYACFTSGKVTSALLLRKWRHLTHNEGVLIHFAGSRELAARSIMAILKQRRDYLENQ
jgi:ERCC4-type nuclease